MWGWVFAMASAHGAEPMALTLADALARLESDGPDLAAAVARADAARGIARQADAAWLPVLVAGGSYTRNDSEVVLSFSNLADALPIPLDLPADVTIQPLDVWNALATLKVPLFAPTAWAEAASAGRAADAAAATTAEARLQLAQAVVQAAASAEAAAGVVAAAERASTVAEEHLQSLRVAQAAGTATGVDVLAGEADVARQRSALVQSRAELARVQEQLGGLLGVDGPVRVTFPEGETPTDGAAERPALAAADLQVRAAKDRVNAAWFRQLPTISATGTAVAATEPFSTGNQTAWKVGLEGTWTLYDGGLRYGKLDQARAELAGARAFADAEALRVSREVRDAERDVGVAREQLTLAQEVAELADKAASVAQKGLAAGTTSAQQARDLDADAFRAQVGVATAQARVRIAEATLRRSRGLDQRW